MIKQKPMNWIIIADIMEELSKHSFEKNILAEKIGVYGSTLKFYLKWLHVKKWISNSKKIMLTSEGRKIYNKYKDYCQ